MDKERLKQESAKFNKDGSAYVHTEMEDGKAPKTVLCGDLMAMLWCIVGEINRVSEITKVPFDVTLRTIGVIHRLGYEEAKKVVDDGTEYKKYEGCDFYEDAKQAAQAEADAKLNNLQTLNDKLAKENDRLRKMVKFITEEKVHIQKKATRDAVEHSKQIKKMEHEIQDLLRRQGRVENE